MHASRPLFIAPSHPHFAVLRRKPPDDSPEFEAITAASKGHVLTIVAPAACAGKALCAGFPFSVPAGRGSTLVVGDDCDGIPFLVDGLSSDPVTLILCSDQELAMELDDGRQTAEGTGVITWSFGVAAALCPFAWDSTGMLQPAQDRSVALGVSSDGVTVVLVDAGDSARCLIFEYGRESPPGPDPDPGSSSPHVLDADAPHEARGSTDDLLREPVAPMQAPVPGTVTCTRLPSESPMFLNKGDIVMAQAPVEHWSLLGGSKVPD